MEKEQVLEKVKELIAELAPQAKRKAWFDLAEDAFDVHGLSGGKFDDAYEGGVKDGETAAAREISQRLMILRNELES
jgi:hypothetical protein